MIMIEYIPLLNLYYTLKKGYYYFDASGKSLSIPNGLQTYSNTKKFVFMITTYVGLYEQSANVTYTFSIILPSGISLMLK